VAPLAVPLVAVLYGPAEAAFGAAAIAYFGLALGAPILLLLQAKHLASAWLTAAVGFVIGVITWMILVAVMTYFSSRSTGEPTFLQAALVGLLWAGVLGAVVATIFRLVAGPASN
jgi:hypothetical protein